jgi:hypothetical protein
MGGIRSAYGRNIKCMKNFELETLNERGHLGNIGGVKGRITLKWIVIEVACEGVDRL